MALDHTGLEHYRELRRELETAVLPLATSLDGRRFTFQASLHGLAFRLGGYVVLETADSTHLGQILALRADRQEGAAVDVAMADDGPAVRAGVTIRHASGEGRILDADATPFHDAMVRGATADEVRAGLGGSRSPLAIGELALVPGVAANIDARGFDRHTFMCGQSGSGKTHSLGVMLEQLLTDTSLRIVVLDPNSDFARLATVRSGVDAPVAERYEGAAAGVAVHSARAEGATRLRLRIAELEPSAQAALLRLDPVADREEHAELVALLAAEGTPSLEALEANPAGRRLALRARNLGADSFGVWARGEPGSVLEAVCDPTERCVVVDLGSLATREEQALVSAAVLGELWRRRENRDPVLIVIDEAHNVCPAMPEDPLTALATEHAVRIAAEGRKFGLYLLVSTQRPQKVQENVVSQCDNLVLMRLNSRADAAFAEAIFSFVPGSLVEQSSGFTLGEALVAGKISPHPSLVRFGARVSEEGGSDVPSTWADL